jgi:hypothetical protein
LNQQDRCPIALATGSIHRLNHEFLKSRRGSMSVFEVEADHAAVDGRPAKRFDDTHIHWKPFGQNRPPREDGTHVSDGQRYWVLGVNPQRQTVDVLFKLDPGTFCTPHRHVGPTDVMVIEGIHRNYKRVDGEWVCVEDRKPGTLSISEGDNFHLESGGPEGAIVHLHMLAVDGLIWEVFDDNDELSSTATLEDFQHVLDWQSGRVAKLNLRQGSSL